MDDASIHTFPRSKAPLPVAVKARGCEIWDTTGRRYLDASGGAVVVGIGHGSERVSQAIQVQLSEIAYVHPTQLVGRQLDVYTNKLAPLLPIEHARIYPVSGGSDAVEAALKLARCYHLARGDTKRDIVISRWGSYHGNTRGALDVTGRVSARAPYAPWLGLARHQPAVNEYRCLIETHPRACGAAHADMLEKAILAEGSDRVAAFIAEPIVGATLAVSIPPDDYWPAIAEVCRKHGVLLILDEIMTGFGRTGRWFAAEHWATEPDILVAAKGVCSGYWPMGLVCCKESIYEAVSQYGFPHGGTFSHSPMGTAIALSVLQELMEEDLVKASRLKGEYLLDALRSSLSKHPNVGDIRGAGLFAGVEFVEDRDSKRPFSRDLGLATSLAAAALAAGLIIYPSTGCAGDEGGDAVILAPPFVVTKSQIDEAVEIFSAVVQNVVPDRAKGTDTLAARSKQ